MVGGLAVSGSGATHFEAKITPLVIISCIMAATGGLMFGYDVGVSGGVTSMDDFLMKFFPKVYKRKKEPGLDSNYCKYDNQGLQLFTSSLYLAGLTSTFFASYTTRRLGRRLTMLIAGVFFLVGVIFNGTAQNLAMLIVGRILLGCGVGFANQAIPLFLSEIAPTRIRGGLNILFQLNITIGILFANLVNYGTAKIHPWGWRLSLALAGIPAMLLTGGALLVTDTPNSLIERGHLDEGKAVLRKIRGTDNVDAEFDEIVEASRVAQEVKHPFRNLLKRRNRPQLVISILLQIFQQFTGINAIMFYAPVLFNTLGFKSDASLYSAVITGAVNVLSTVVVDLLGGQARAAGAAPGGRGADVPVAGRDRGPPRGEARGPLRHAGEGVRGAGGGDGVHLRVVVRVVVGAPGVADPERDVPAGDAVGGAERDGVREPAVHVRHRAGVPVHAVPPQVRDLRLLLGVGAGHVGLRALPAAGDEERPHRGDDREGLEAALVLEALHERRGRCRCCQEVQWHQAAGSAIAIRSSLVASYRKDHEL
ncbi:putative sugar transport protein 13 [Iris pallida]|uniref:Sugar transport protein 13 n=1 Tax=Iris pallida TaxID=29817 RepID=A0AAX6EZ51_IRIPA|nr:putative sugar transport protein 13 [Iris pallida]